MGLFGNKKGLVGLDIGSSAIKAVELKAGGKGGAEYQLVNLGVEPLPPEAIVDGAIMDSGAVIDAIQRVFSAQKINLTLARPYARAAFALARDNGAFAPWSNALAFAARVAADPQVAPQLGSPKLTDADAVALLAIDGASDQVRSFLGLLADNRRLALLPEMAGLFEELRAEAERVVKARITSATVLGEGDLAGIKAALKKRFGREVELETAVDASLIGGAVIDAGDVVIDGSLKGKLSRLQSALAS